jgi:hypothetical protein
MNNKVTIGRGPLAAAILAVLLGACGAPSGGLGSQATPTPEPTGTPSPSATIRPTPSPTSAPPLTQSFTSTLHGISISYPEGWADQAATEPLIGAATFPNFGEPPADFLYDPGLTDHLFIAVASQRIGDSTLDQWAAEKLAQEECALTEPITVDGATGLIGAAGCNIAAVTTDGRGYMVGLYTSGDEAWLSSTFDRAWFEEVLATVQLHPEDAVDTLP